MGWTELGDRGCADEGRAGAGAPTLGGHTNAPARRAAARVLRAKREQERTNANERANAKRSLPRGKPARIRKAIPKGSLNAVAIQLLLDYTQIIESQTSQTPSPKEDTAA